MTMKTIVWILLALSLHLNVAESEDQLTCRRSNCACYSVDPGKTRQLKKIGKVEENAMRCSHAVYRQNLSLSQSLSLRGSNDPDAEVNELLSFPFIELSISISILSIHCLNFDFEHISTTKTPLFDLIPKLNLGALESVLFEGCPVPDEPFETLFNILNATNVDGLGFAYSRSNIIRSPLAKTTRDLFSNLPSLTALDISSNNISALEPGVFTHLVHLEDLGLSNNKITTLDKDIFKNLTSLDILSIGNNRLVTLTHDLFSNIYNLKILDISSNNISALVPGLFQHLIHLEKLYLNNNKITTLDRDIFENLTSLDYLNIDNNRLVTLTHDLFSNQRSLKYLNICNNNISALEPGVFEHLIHLEYLHVSNNIITSLDQNIFKNLTSLEYLFIDNNRLVTLTHDLFSNLHNLKILDISSNNIIGALEPGLFQHLMHLEKLYLSNNKITTLDRDIFENLTSLDYLNIDNNRLVTLTHDLFSNQRSLISLNISNNNISVLPHGIFDNLTMVYKILSNGNTFKKFPGNLFSKTPLEIVSLQYQRSSRSIPENCFSNLSNLEEVDSPLKEVPSDLFRNASNVRTIYLTGYKQLVSLPEKLFYDCKELSELDLSDNGLETLHETLFLHSKSLTVVNLSRNRLKSLPVTLFHHCKELSEIDLSDNGLETLQEEYLFLHSKSLTVVNLSRNRLESITPHLFAKVSLERLNLSHNALKQFADLTSLHFLCIDKTNLKSIDYSNNCLKTVISELSYCHALKEIKLSNNSISHISNKIFNLKGLETLDMKWNNITSIPDYVFSSTVSTNMTLDLSHNQIEIVEFTSTPAVREGKYDFTKRNIILNGNPIACNSSNYNLFRFIKDTMMSLETDKCTVIHFETNNINTCKPSNMSINTIDPSELTCDTVAGCPSSCNCIYFPHYDQIIVNCSSANLTHMPQNLNITLEDKRAIPLNLRKTKNRTIQLILRNNSIQQLLLDTPEIYAWITVLDLSFNKIKDSKDILQHLPRLETLNLSHNHLESLGRDFIDLLSSSKYISSLFLSSNKWKCDCNITDLHNFLSSYKKEIVKDSEEIICHDLRQLYKMKSEDFCTTPPKVMVVLSIILAPLGVLGLLVTCFYHKFQHEIKVWLFAHQILLCWVSEEDIDRDKVYDAFVSYNEEDFGFVVKTLIPELEKSFRICHHERDFVPGEFITEQIHEKVNQSRRTIIVLTEHFLKSRWGDLEFRTAHAQAMKDNCARVIILIYGDMPPQEAMSETMKTYMSMNTYIKWGDKWFWDKLKYALPHPPARLSHDFHNAFAQSNTTQNASNSMPMQNITGSNPAQVCSATSSSQTKP